MSVAGGLRDEVDLLLLFGREAAVDPVQQQAAEGAHRVERRAELMAHVGKEFRLHLVRAPQVIGFLVELGVQGHHAAVRIFQLPVELDELVLFLAQFRECADQLAVLLLQFLIGATRSPRGEFRSDATKVVPPQQARAGRKDFLEQDVRAVLRAGADLHPVHETVDAGDADAHSGL